jgi:tRNA-dihydrouridine synthase 1
MNISSKDNSAYEFWKSIGEPKYVCAPMVDQSELTFRLLTRKYNTHLTYTPMIHSVMFTTCGKYRERFLQDLSPNDYPCFVQFCGHDPEILLKAAKLVKYKCQAVDLNLGCPQGIAKRGFYGSYLLEDVDLGLKIVGYLCNNLDTPVTCKIRLFPDILKSIQLARNLEDLGIKVLTVHGRTKEQKKLLTGKADWEAIRTIKESINIPLIANGGIERYEDIEECFKATNCDAVMSSEKLLEYPALYDNTRTHNLDDIALEYLNLCLENNYEIHAIRSHLFKFYYTEGQKNNDFNNKLGNANTLEGFIEIANEMKTLRQDIPDIDKQGWYMRYRRDHDETDKGVLVDNLYADDFSDIFK